LGSNSGEHFSMHQQEYFETLCNTADGVFIVNEDKQIVRWNKGAERIFKFSESEVLRQECFRIVEGKVSPDKTHCNPNCAIHSNAMTGACRNNFDLLTRAKDGEPVWLNISFIASPNPNERFLAHILRDITHGKKTEFALNQFLADLNALSLISKDKGKDNSNNMPTGRNSPLDKPSAALSEREIEVLTLLAEGLPTKSLAQKLNISHFTARNHIQNILVKLELHSKAQAVSYAFKKGIL
jgi:PAS domain S-box-containing protein